MTPDAAPSPSVALSARLKAETQELHTRAERHPAQRELVTGSASAAGYTAYLTQMYWAHHGFETALRAATLRDAALSGLVQDYHFRLAQIQDDLAHFDTDPSDATPSAATSRFAAWTAELARSEPASLIGVLYVLEGSTNGGRYIARALRRAMALQTPRGTAYFDPHGEAQSERWQAFKTTLDSLNLSAPAQDRIVAAAGATFSAIIEIMDALPRPAVAEPAVARA